LRSVLRICENAREFYIEIRKIMSLINLDKEIQVRKSVRDRLQY